MNCVCRDTPYNTQSMFLALKLKLVFTGLINYFTVMMALRTSQGLLPNLVGNVHILYIHHNRSESDSN